MKTTLVVVLVSVATLTAGSVALAAKSSFTPPSGQVGFRVVAAGRTANCTATVDGRALSASVNCDVQGDLTNGRLPVTVQLMGRTADCVFETDSGHHRASVTCSPRRQNPIDEGLVPLVDDPA